MQTIHLETFFDAFEPQLSQQDIEYVHKFQNSASPNPKINNEIVRNILKSYDNYFQETLKGKHG